MGFEGGIFNVPFLSTQHCFVYQPLLSTVSEDSGIEPRTVAIPSWQSDALTFYCIVQRTNATRRNQQGLRRSPRANSPSGAEQGEMRETPQDRHPPRGHQLYPGPGEHSGERRGWNQRVCQFSLQCSLALMLSSHAGGQSHGGWALVTCFSR